MSVNDTQSGLVAKAEKFSYIEAKQADIGTIRATNIVTGATTASVATPAVNYLSNGDSNIITSAAGLTITLSSADAAVAGRMINTKDGSGGGASVETEGAEVLDGGTLATPLALGPYGSATWASDGSNWFRLY
jgi:hypothetical protein